jgi:hypothetical protein
MEDKWDDRDVKEEDLFFFAEFWGLEKNCGTASPVILVDLRVRTRINTIKFFRTEWGDQGLTPAGD